MPVKAEAQTETEFPWGIKWRATWSKFSPTQALPSFLPCPSPKHLFLWNSTTLQWHLSNRQVTQCPWQHIWVLQALTNYVKGQALKGCRPCHIVKALIEFWSESQTLKACWPCHVVKALIERIPQSQAVKACWPCHIVQVLIESSVKNQNLKACWPCHVVQALIESSCKSQTLKACWPCQVVQALIEI